MAERRPDPTTNSKKTYSKQQFINFYGKQDGEKMWKKGGRLLNKGGDGAERRRDPTDPKSKKTYTREDFIGFYGGKQGAQMWNKAAKQQKGPLKMLVYGHKGWIGGQLMAAITAAGHKAIGAESRADNEKDVEKELRKVKPDRVFSIVGRTRGGEFLTIDYLEQKGKLIENMRDNLYAPLTVGVLCKKYGIHYSYMGTGCIFEYKDDKTLEVQPEEALKGTKSGKGFKDDDPPNFFASSYSTCKGFTDRLMHGILNDSALNMRIRMPIVSDHAPYNFITKIVKYQKVIDIPNSMTVLPEMIPLMVKASAKKVTGTYNWTNPGAISHTQVLDLYRKHVDPDFWYSTFSTEEQDKILLSGRSNNLLETRKIKKLFPKLDNIHTAVEKIMIQMAKDSGKIEHGKGPRPSDAKTPA